MRVGIIFVIIVVGIFKLNFYIADKKKAEATAQVAAAKTAQMNDPEYYKRNIDLRGIRIVHDYDDDKNPTLMFREKLYNPGTKTISELNVTYKIKELSMGKKSKSDPVDLKVQKSY